MAIRVSMAFCKLSDEPLVPFATGVRDGLAGNPTLFPDPPVTPDELDAANKAFGVALVAANQGSVAQTAAKNNARLALIALLRQLAVFVESKARGDVQIILVAGFDFTNRGHSPQLPLAKPNIIRILNQRSTQLVVGVTRVPTARSFEAQVRIGQGPWAGGGDSSAGATDDFEGPRAGDALLDKGSGHRWQHGLFRLVGSGESHVHVTARIV